MKIQNLNTVTNLDDYESFLLNRKIKMLGGGAFAHVYQHPTVKNIAVKVFDKNEDYMYFNYLKWCLKNQNNPYVPKIYQVFKAKKCDKTENQICIVFMEKLRGMTEKEYTKLVNKLCNKRKSWYLDWSKIAKHSKDPHLMQIAKYLNSSKIRESEDMHEGNVMWRLNQPVFTDPVASS